MGLPSCHRYIHQSDLLTIQALYYKPFTSVFAEFKPTAFFFLPTQLSSVWSLRPLGGAPNYYPNSFSAPETQPRFVESKFKVSPDVARYNSADEDNVTQVKIMAKPFVPTRAE